MKNAKGCAAYEPHRDRRLPGDRGDGTVIHYHGLPITPATAAHAAIAGGHAFISFRHPDQIGLALDVCQSFAVDNGAFSAWRAGEPVTDWRPYYEWVAFLRRMPSFDWAVIPDVIDGDHITWGNHVCRLLRMMRYEEDVPSLNQRRRAKKRQLERFITTAYRSAAHAMQ